MSFDFEESPLSDNKMDISDSVSAEEESGANVENAENYVESNVTLMGLEYEIQKALPLLDNRIGRPEVLLEPVLKTNSAARTLANSHPLMSPSATDSDSEEQNYIAGIDIKCHNFPDVVPCSERLQTANANTVLTRNTLNRVRGNVNTTPSHNKLSILRAHSPDLLSSESEADVSQYHAAVEANCQTVALKSNGQHKTDYSGVHRINKLGNTLIGCEDISSLDSISNQSFEDDDIEHNLASLSPSSSLMDGLGDDNNDNDCEELEPNFLEVNTPTPNKALEPLSSIHAQSLPQYSAVEEHRNSRNWQKITLPDGRAREIDMRVIEPYKRVLSHGGYLKAGGHNAIVMFCACHLPDHSRADYNYVMDNLFLYVVKTLEQLVTEDYVLIYLHGGSSRRNMPPFPWLKKCYQLLDHRLRKSLKNMYLVHPTFWIKSIVWMTRPFVSAKFWRKLVYVKSLEELSAYVAVERAAIPEKVKLYDTRHN